MAETEVKLREELSRHSKIMECSRVAADMLSSEKRTKQMNSYVGTVNDARNRIQRDKEETTGMINALEEKKHAVEGAIQKDYHAAMEGTPGYEESSEPNEQLVVEEIQRTKKKTKELERDMQKLENEKKILAFHKRHRNLQRKIAPVEFDMSSTDKHVKGYLQKSDGTVEVFEYDFTKDSPCDIADYIWDNI